MRGSVRPSPLRDLSLKILVVDDEPGVARALQRTLRDHDVTIALSGRQAISILFEAAPAFDLIFCDLMMAEVSGMDLYGTVTKRKPELSERFVFMTGGAFTEQARDFVAKVSNPLLEKPFDIHHVQSLVQKAAMGACGAQSEIA